MSLMEITFKKFWCGINSNYVLWLDIGSDFSIDVGKWFIRMYIKQLSFCRYLGIIN